MEAAREENEALKEKINGLKQQYGPIGKQVQGVPQNMTVGEKFKVSSSIICQI